jgi:hypothetical protein
VNYDKTVLSPIQGLESVGHRPRPVQFVHWLALNPALHEESCTKTTQNWQAATLKVTDSCHGTEGQFSFSFEHFHQSNGEKSAL